MGLFPGSGRPMQMLDPEFVGTEWWSNALWQWRPSLHPPRSPRHLSRFPAYPSHYQLRAAIRRSAGRALKSIPRTLLNGRRSSAPSASHRWMLPTVERGPPVHISV
jgi:hypothetical protein